MAGVRADSSVRASRRSSRATSRSSASSRRRLCRITGFAAVSLQPNSGAQGEFAGLMTIRAYHHDRGQHGRNVVLIPSSAHGTNPASAAMAGLKVVVVACDTQGNVDLADLKAKAAQHSARAVGADGDLSVDARRLRGGDPRDLQRRARAGRTGLHGRREHERAGRADQPGGDRRRRLPSQPPQDVRDSARRRRARHGADRRGAAPRAVPARTSDREGRRRQGDSRGIGGAVGQRQHPADLVRLHPDARRPGHDRRDPGRDPQRQLHQGAAASALRGALRQSQRPGRARADLRPASLQARRRAHGRRAGRRQAADGLRLSRADGLVPGGRDDDGGADGERIEGRARSVLRGADLDSRARFRMSSTAAPTPATTSSRTRRTPPSKCRRTAGRIRTRESRRRTRRRSSAPTSSGRRSDASTTPTAIATSSARARRWRRTRKNSRR